MQSFVVFSCVIAAALALPVDIAEVFLTEDTAGNYKLSFKSKAITRDEERSENGEVHGSYSFVDPEGVQHMVSYVAASEYGFLAESDDIPMSVPEGEELVKARSEHLAAFAAEQAKFPHGVPEERPVPVSEVLANLVIPEIASLPADAVPAEGADIIRAKAELLAEYSKVLTKLAEEYKKL